MRILSFLFLLTLTVLSTDVCYGNEALSHDLVQRIDAAKQALDKTQASISNEKRSYAKRLGDAERAVAALRKQASVIQREADEQLVSLQKLQERLTQWQDQQDFQEHLLSRHLDLVSENSLAVPDRSTPSADILHWSVDRGLRALEPQWKAGSVALTSGEFVSAQVLELGPARFYYAPERSAAGLYKIVPGRHLESYFSYNGAALRELDSIVVGRPGQVTFDPTLGRAIDIAQHEESLWQHLLKGGVWVVPILFFGAFALLIAIFKGVQLSRLSTIPRKTVYRIKSLLEENTTSSREAAAKLLDRRHQAYRRMVGIVSKHPPSEQRDDLLYSFINDQRRNVEKYLGAISLTAAVAPLLGLLGTVSGMITTFKMLTIFGSGDPAAVSGGISEALVTTELGLVVAIPALVINAFLSRKARRYMSELEDAAIILNTPDNGKG